MTLVNNHQVTVALVPMPKAQLWKMERVALCHEGCRTASMTVVTVGNFSANAHL